MTLDAYRQLYLDGWRTTREASSGEAPLIEARWLREPVAPPDRRPLAFFFEDGVVCGRASSLEDLRKYAFDPDSLYAAADERVRELIEALALPRENLAKVEGSASWRMTAPFRSLARRLGRRGKPPS